MKDLAVLESPARLTGFSVSIERRTWTGSLVGSLVALAIVLFLFIFVFTMVQLFVQRKWVNRR